ncbi:threonine synthase [Chitinophaga pendula]|uniref:threonine synthase n=1 Tax=Chitinophaga TaxID=79328 RepID=UPI000BAFE2C8|nr:MULTISPECIES: threonine synthase [Chitinophaga]ASZ13607.1 threonine synthase [Chitinophaga sp. MD30]UCJ08768.1 threonine synthase [Chitinophaga pendula]
MQYYSLHQRQHEVSFREAVIRGLAPDKGLYFPTVIPRLDPLVAAYPERYDERELAYQVIQPFVGDAIPEAALRGIIRDTVSFPFPLRAVGERVYSLELFHGPTLAFKDVGARFMAGCLGYFRGGDAKPVTVLVATSGDTGGAVASGFYGVPGVEVVILYPSGKVSTLQEKQLTTLGGNISALAVSGTFDDCQQLVKTAFLDAALQEQRPLTSANSINVARWLPQMFYYFLALRQLGAQERPPVFSVPSGNFGNICAGLMAAALGLPVAHFVASTNINDTVPRFMDSGHYTPGTAFPTLSNAMDVSDPSNFVRILQLFGNDRSQLAAHFSSYAFTDEQTVATMEAVWQRYGYMLDPHGAVGYLGLQRYLRETGYAGTGIFLETAHPVKFADTAPSSLQAHIETPARIQALYAQEKQATALPATYEALREWLLQ